MSQSNRRTFLKLAAATAVTANSPFTWASTPGKARAWVTSQDPAKLRKSSCPPMAEARAGRSIRYPN